MTTAEQMAVAFARILRGAGLKVPTGSVLTFVDALGVVGMEERNPVYWVRRLRRGLPDGVPRDSEWPPVAPATARLRLVFALRIDLPDECDPIGVTRSEVTHTYSCK